MYDVVVKVIGDMKVAIWYFWEDVVILNQFWVDINLIFVGGIFVGVIIVVYVVYLDEIDDILNYFQNIIVNNGGIEGNSSDNYQYSFFVVGLVNYFGVLKDVSFIDVDDLL